MHHDAATLRKLTSALRGAPAWLRPSALVDLTQVLLGVRPALRTKFGREVDGAAVSRWARGLGCYVSLDGDGFLVLARRPGLSRRVLALDRRPNAHALALGLALGYPPCCARAAGRIGEAQIDAWSRSLAAKRFIGAYRCINPEGYLQGTTPLSHVPCSPRCARSLRMAQHLVKLQGGPFTAHKRRRNATVMRREMNRDRRKDYS